jgi:hypothetical protein
MRVFEQVEQPFLMIVQGDVAISEQVLVFLDKLVCILDDVCQDRFRVDRRDADIHEIHHVFVYIRDVDVSQLDQGIQVKRVVTVLFFVKLDHHLFHKSQINKLHDLWIDVGADVFDSDLVGGLQFCQVHLFYRFIKGRL